MAFPASRVSFMAKSLFMKNWLGSANIAPAASLIQVATLRCTFGDKFPYPKPWPYKEKKFNVVYALFDDQQGRLNENTRVITVEGNVGVGKKDFAKRLAKEFDLLYIPPSPEEDAWIWNKSTGMDAREVDFALPPDCRIYDMKQLFADENPEHGKIGNLFYFWYREKIKNYARALLHCLSTGQGVVTVRSIFSEEVMLKAFRKMNWITANYHKYHKTILIDNSLPDFLRPHLFIYLDAPPEVCLERIKQRNDPREQGKNMNLKYLQAVEDSYRQNFLDAQRMYSEVMEIDWTEIGDDIEMDVIADEISRLTLENTDPESPKFKEWRILNEDSIGRMRLRCQDEEWELKMYVDGRPGATECIEVFGTAEQQIAWNKLYTKHPALAMKSGYSRELGNNPSWRFF